MRIKRLFATVLCLCMIFSLAACSSATAKGSSGNSSSNSADKYAKKIKISWAYVIEGDKGFDYTKDAVAQYLSKKFNVEWNVIPLTWDNWSDKLRIWINSGDMPDVVKWNYVNAEFMNYVDQGMVRKFPSDWKSKWTNVAKMYDSTSLGPQLDKTLNNETYGIPQAIFYLNKPADTLVEHYMCYMRKDWVKAVGAPIKKSYTINEILDIARKIKAQDPGKVGSGLYPICSYPNMMTPFLPDSYYNHANPNAVFYKGSDGKYKWGPADEKTYEGLKILQDAYKEGLVYPDFYTLKQGEDENRTTITGNSAIFMAGGLGGNYQLFYNEMKQNTKLNPDDALMSAYITDNNGKYETTEVANYFGMDLFNPKMDDEKFSRVMDIMDYLLTKEGQTLVSSGFKDVDYSVQSDGSLKSEVKAGQAITDKYPSIRFFSGLAMCHDDFALVDPTIPEQFRQLHKQQYIDKLKDTDSNTLAKLDWKVLLHSSPAQNKIASLNYPTEYANLVVSKGDLKTNWQSWVKKEMQLIQPVLDELNSNSTK